MIPVTRIIIRSFPSKLEKLLSSTCQSGRNNFVCQVLTEERSLVWYSRPKTSISMLRLHWGHGFAKCREKWLLKQLKMAPPWTFALCAQVGYFTPSLRLLSFEMICAFSRTPWVGCFSRRWKWWNSRHSGDQALNDAFTLSIQRLYLPQSRAISSLRVVKRPREMEKICHCLLWTSACDKYKKHCLVFRLQFDMTY